MKNFSLIVLILAASIASQTAVLGSDHGQSATDGGNTFGPVSREELDRFVHDYVKAVRSAPSVDVLSEFLPAERMHSLTEQCTPQERSDWLQFRRMMPTIVRLMYVKEKKNLALLTYACSDKQPASDRSKQPVVAKITLIKEDGKLKIGDEHFGPADLLLPSARKATENSRNND